MSRKLILIILVILASGSIATLISGFCKQDFSLPGMTRIGYGFPLVWHGYSRAVVYPEPPRHYCFSWESLILDIAFWSLVIAVPAAIVTGVLEKRTKVFLFGIFLMIIALIIASAKPLEEFMGLPLWSIVLLLGIILSSISMSQILFGQRHESARDTHST